jgi:excisionase family DNA binding protein
VSKNFANYFDSLDGFLTVNQVCEILGIHHDTLYRWVRENEIPTIRVGTAAKPLLRFVPKDLATWVRDLPRYFHGPTLFITNWMESQIRDHGRPRLLLDPLPKALELTGYDWLQAAQHIKNQPSLSSFSVPLFEDFLEALKELSLEEQRQLLSDIKSGKYDQDQ